MGTWEAWWPLQKASGEYRIESFTDDFEEIYLVLKQHNSDVDTNIRITFFSGHEIYRKSNESYRLRLWAYLDETHASLHRKWSMYKVADSDFLHYYSVETSGITEILSYGHYSFMDSEWIFDIASQQQPQVDLIVNGVLIERSKCRWHDERYNK